MISHDQKLGVAFALGAAALFGASTPVAKVLGGAVHPLLLAGILYLGSGVGLGVWLLIRGGSASREASLRRPDLPWLAGATVSGGAVGPALLMYGLAVTPASTSSLLLNLEGVFTAVVAWVVFREHFHARIATGMALITCGGIVLSWTGLPDGGGPAGPLLVTGACFAWALDNNLTRRISGADPVQIACIKGLAAGSVNTLLALRAGTALPSIGTIALAGAVGLAGYGISLVLFVLALRHAGTSRTGAYFSIAPFVGSIVAIAALSEPITASLAVSGLLMATGVWLHISERHEHEHEHERLTHTHSHRHDDGHHDHEHTSTAQAALQHSHAHTHTGHIHIHAHFPDTHHRHDH